MPRVGRTHIIDDSFHSGYSLSPKINIKSQKKRSQSKGKKTNIKTKTEDKQKIEVLTSKVQKYKETISILKSTLRSKERQIIKYESELDRFYKNKSKLESRIKSEEDLGDELNHFKNLSKTLKTQLEFEKENLETISEEVQHLKSKNFDLKSKLENYSSNDEKTFEELATCLQILEKKENEFTQVFQENRSLKEINETIIRENENLIHSMKGLAEKYESQIEGSEYLEEEIQRLRNQNDELLNELSIKTSEMLQMENEFREQIDIITDKTIILETELKSACKLDSNYKEVKEELEILKTNLVNQKSKHEGEVSRMKEKFRYRLKKKKEKWLSIYEELTNEVSFLKTEMNKLGDENVFLEEQLRKLKNRE